jgi:hypothetical protein
MHEHQQEREHRAPRPGVTAQAAEWDARYTGRGEAMWSGQPNGRLVAEVAGLTPGRALEVGCGEGADAIWLDGRGWSVAAIGVDDLGRLLADDFTVERHAVEPRIDPPPDTPHIADVILRTRRH